MPNTCMRSFLAATLWPAFSLLALSGAAQPDPPRTDLHGDPLPKGALQRLGTLHYRQETSIEGFAFAPDGKTYVTAGRKTNDAPAMRLWSSTTGKEILRFSGDHSVVSQVAFAPDGKTIAGAYGLDVIIWDAATGKLLRKFPGNPGSIMCLAWSPSPDAKSIAVGGGDNTVRLFDAATGNLIRTFDKDDSWTNRVAFSPDGKHLASSSVDWLRVHGDVRRLFPGYVSIWDTATGKRIHHLDRGGSVRRKSYTGLSEVAFSTDLTLVAFAGWDGRLEVWDIAAAKKRCDFAWNGRGSFAFTPGSKSLVIVAEDASIGLWDANTGKHLRDLAGLGGRHDIIAGIDPSNRYLATILNPWRSDTAHVHLLDLANGTELTGEHGHQDAISFIQATADGKFVVTAALDGSVRLWDSATGRPLQLLTGYRGTRGAVALAADSKTLAAIDRQGTVQVLDLPGCKSRLLLETNKKYEASLALSPDGRVLALGHWQGPVSLHDAHSGKQLATMPIVAAAICFSPDGQMLATMAGHGDGQRVKLWRVNTGKELLAFQTPDSGFQDPDQFSRFVTFFRSFAFSPDGRWLALTESLYSGKGGWENTRLFLWEVATGQLVADVDKLPCDATVHTFMPDGLTLVACSGQHWSRVDPAATFWDPISGAAVGRLNGHLGSVTYVAFTADGRKFLTGGTDGTVLVWDALALPRSKPPAPRKLSVAELTALWDDLATNDARKAYQAIATLTGGGKQSISFLEERLQPVKFLTAAELAPLVAALDDKTYAVRAKATAVLETQGEPAAKLLRKALMDGMTLEKRRRVEWLLGKLESFTPPPKDLRTLRALAVLERIGNDQARKLIDALAGGSPEARLTQQARAVLARWEKNKG
jgi:WD40 repeat protein